MAVSRFEDHVQTGDHASRPAATAVAVGTLYSCTDHDLVYQSDGSTWSTWATLSAGSAQSQQLSFAQTGTLSTGTGTMNWPAPFALTVVGVIAAVDTAPTGDSVIVDVNKNGTTIFTTQGNRPTVAATATISDEETPDVTAVAAGDIVSVDIDQVGSTVAGADLVVAIEFTT